MEYIFDYDVKTIRTEVVIGIDNAGAELTAEQSERLMQSLRSGKFSCIDEDESLADILAVFFREAIAVEKQMEYGDEVGTKITVCNFRYPEQLHNTV